MTYETPRPSACSIRRDRTIKRSKAVELRRIYEANTACGDIGEAEEARMLADIAATEAEEHATPYAVAA